MCLISPISCWTSLAFRATRSGWWMNSETFTIFNPSSFVGIFFVDGYLNTKKIRIALRQWRSNFLGRGRRQNMERKTESYVFSVFGNGVSRSQERKSTTGRFATGRLWSCTQKTSTVGNDQVQNWEFCILKIRSLVVLVMMQCIFSSSALALISFYDIYSGIVDPSIFIRTTLLCLYNKQNNTWLLVDMKFLFSCSTRHLTRSLCSLVSYRGKN